MKRSALISLLKALGFLSFGSAILYLVYRNINQKYLEDCLAKGGTPETCSLAQKVITDFREVNYWWLLAVVLVFMLSNVARAIRWNMLFKTLAHKVHVVNSFFAIMLGYFANLGLPRAGEFVRGSTIAAYEGVPFEKTMGTIVVDRMADFFCLALVIALSLIFEYELVSSYMEQVFSTDRLRLLWYAAGALAFLTIAFFFLRQWIYKTALFQKLRSIVRGFLEGINSVRKLDRVGLFVFYSLFIWLCYYLMNYFCFFSFEPTAQMHWQQGLVVFVLGAIGMVIPSPGGMGSYHAMIIAALMLYGVEEYDGFSYANLIFFTVQIFGNIFFGILALIVLPIFNKSKKALNVPSQS